MMAINNNNRYTQAIKKTNNNTTYILLCAGKSRYRQFTKYNNALLNYDSESKIIDKQINIIRSVDRYSDIIVAAGFKSNELITHLASSNVRVVENCNFAETTSLESLKLAINASLYSNLVVIHGDVDFNAKAIKIKGSKDPLVVINKESNSGESIYVAYQDQLVKNLSYGMSVGENTHEWGEIFYMPATEYYMIKNLINNIKKHNTIPDIINHMNNTVQFKIYWDKGVSVNKIYTRIKL